VGGRSRIGGATGDGRPRIIQDVTGAEEWRRNPLLPETRAELAIPLRVRGRIIGALTVQSAEANAFSPVLISTLQTMGDQLAVAIENAQLLRRAETRAQRQQQLNRISASLHRTADIDEIVRVGLGAIAEQLDGVPVAITLGTNQQTPPSQQGD
jgi:GAF domain-containing protein